MIFLNKKGELVWAKIKNFPWWPAYVTDIIRGNVYEQVKVDFINLNVEITLGNNKVADYKRYNSKYYDSKNKALVEACKIADSIIKDNKDFSEVKKAWNNKPIPLEILGSLKGNGN